MAPHRFWLPPSTTQFAQYTNALQWNDEAVRAHFSGTIAPPNTTRFVGDRDGIGWKDAVLSRSDSFIVDSRFKVYDLPGLSFKNIYKTLAQKVAPGMGEGNIPAAGAIDYGHLHEIDWRIAVSRTTQADGTTGDQSILLREAFRVPAGTEYWFICGHPGSVETPTVVEGWAIAPAGTTSKISGAGILADGNKYVSFNPAARGETAFVQLMAIPDNDEYIILGNRGLSTPSFVGSEIDWPAGE